MRRKNKIKIIKRILLFLMVVCLILIGREFYLSISHKNHQEELRELLREENAQKELYSFPEKMERQQKENTSGSKTAKAKILDKYQDLYQENKDLAGWLTIEGTEIDNPVMQCEDDEYYLHHNFYKEKDKYGCLYVKNIADLNTPGTNFIIYGHNMRDGSMFGSLDEYRNWEFYQEHAEIIFDTLYEERIYEIMAVFLSTVDEAEKFKYYQFYQAETEEEFLDFYKNVKKKSLYDTGVTAIFGDTFLTLSTCYGNSEQERFVIVAKRL